jgi:hypothetical protein
MALHENVRCRALRMSIAAAVFILLPSAAGAEVAVDGVAVPKATSTIDSSQDVIEFQEGGGGGVALVPGRKRYGVCLVAPAPIAALDAELPLAADVTRFVVTVEDGRQFSQCLLASLKAEGSGSKRRLSYCLRCENVTTP